MDKKEVENDISDFLTQSSDSKVASICKKYFKEEDFGDELIHGLVNDMYNIILDEVVSSDNFAIELYYFLLDEKITIDEDEFYSEEEINHG